MSVLLKDPDGQPITDVPIKFFLKVKFVINGSPEIGEAATDNQGIASITYTPQIIGYIPIVAQYRDDNGDVIISNSTVHLEADYQDFYQTKVGLPYTGFPPSLTLLPYSAQQPKAPGFAPITVMEIPGGLPFIPFVSYLAVIILVWSLYLSNMYQVFRIPLSGKTQGLNARLLPLAGMGVVALVGILMVFVLVTGPYSKPLPSH